VFVNINFGNDQVQAIKQAQQFGILAKQTLVIPYVAPFVARDVGPDLMAGVYAASDFWWTLGDLFPVAKGFVAAFETKYGYKPEWGAQAGYMQLAMWADAVERAKSFYPPDVIAAYEAAPELESTVGKVHFRAADHQLVRPVVILRGKKKADMANKDDYYDVVEVVPGEGLMQAPDAFGCKLGPAT
jgi:ABC-type branched-subunit amino acid transport system substrate-binding protein